VLSYTLIYALRFFLIRFLHRGFFSRSKRCVTNVSLYNYLMMRFSPFILQLMRFRPFQCIWEKSFFWYIWDVLDIKVCLRDQASIYDHTFFTLKSHEFHFIAHCASCDRFWPTKCLDKKFLEWDWKLFNAVFRYMLDDKILISTFHAKTSNSFFHTDLFAILNDKLRIGESVRKKRYFST
jgi:hypothetical protein